MISTLDDISEGRCGLNIVTGWNKPEYTQMGLWRGDEYFDRRYDYAREYLTILKDLWRTGETSFKGGVFLARGLQRLSAAEARNSDRLRRAEPEGHRLHR